MRRALIVDDSKTAQMRLKKMLGRYDLEVDTALSGEDALAYLSYRTPVVIFMDHSMEGMDGFEALKIIKANPNTAMIPVIMYTAQKGDVYVGQARALGALDILSKEVIKPSNLERVLRALNIRPMEDEASDSEVPRVTAEGNGSPEAHHARQAPDSNTEKGQNDSQDLGNLDQIRSQIARLFEIHIADVRTQITENTKFIVRRLSRDLEQRKQDDQEQQATADVPEEVVEREVAAERTRLGLVSNSLSLLILLGLASLAWMQFNTRELVSQQTAAAPPPQGANNASEVRALTSEIGGLREALAEERQRKGRLLNAITWAVENDLRFEFGEAPLSENQVNKLYSLVYMLDHAGYSGAVMLEIHLGNFCLVQDAGGTWVPAPADTPVTACTLASELELGLGESDYLSLEYLNFEQTAAPIVEGKLQLEVNMMGTDLPRYPYPPETSQTTAGEWNEAAARNNRLSILF